MRTAFRFLAFSLIGAVLLLALAGGSAYWFVTRSLPMLTGNLELPVLQATVKVYRDQWGVPHIYAKSEHDLFIAQGYVTAQDRLFQMDMLRRTAAGRLSEVMGSSEIDSDRFYRTLGIYRAAEGSVPLLKGSARAAAEAYATGVSAYIDQAIRHHLLPPEFAALGYKPEPWTITDSIAIQKYMAYTLSGHWAAQLFRYQLVQKVGQKRAAEIFPTYAAGATTTINPPPNLDLALDDQTFTHLVAFAPEEHLGSNAWVVAGNKTETGKPFLANDPHLSVQTPALWYEVHLAAPKPYDVIGVTLPGVPGVMLGHNERIAWGAASLGADVQDLYVEQPSESDPHKFRFNDTWEDAKVLQETIRIKGEPSETLEVLVTRHGPIITPRIPRDDFLPRPIFSLRWTGLEPSAELDAILALDRATNWDEFKAALARMDCPAENFVYADVAGNIGYRVSGKIPVRTANNAYMPLPGWTGDDEWQSYIPDKDMLESYNPKSGYLVTANNKVTSDDYAYHITDEWAAPWRATRLDEVLRDARALSLSTMADLQKDMTDLEAKRYAALLLDACRQATDGKWSDLEADARTVLGEWDYVAKADSPGAMVWNQWRLQLLWQLFEPAMGAPLFQQFLANGSADVALSNVLEAYVAGNPSEWFEGGKDSMRSLPRIAEDAFQRAAELVANKQSADMDQWRWGAEHRVSFTHPLSHPPALDRLLDRGPFPVGGDTVSVNATNYQLTAPFRVTSTAVWRQVIDLGDLSRSLDILAPGESGHFMSPYYLNEMQPWLDGTYHPQVFREADLKTANLLNLTPSLK